MEAIINVHSKYDGNPRRDGSRQCDDRFHESRINGVAKAIAAGSARANKSCQPARPVSTHSADDVMEIDAQQNRGGYGTVTTRRAGKVIRQQHVHPQDVDDIADVEEQKEALRQSKIRLGISAAQEIHGVVTLDLQHHEKMTRPSLKTEERSSPRLSEKFVRDDTEQRNTHAAKIQQDVLDDDIDELSRSSPFVWQACANRVKDKPQRKRDSELDEPQIEVGTEVSDDSGSDDLHNGDIRGTTFVRLTGPYQQTKLTNANEREHKARELRQRYRLCFFSSHQCINLDPKELTVESDINSGCFSVWSVGTEAFTIQPKLVQRVDIGSDMGEDGKHIRLLGSKRETEGQYVVHMGFADAEEFQKFYVEFDEVTKGVLNPKWRPRYISSN